MKYKVGVDLNGVQPCTWYAIGITDLIYRAHGQKLIITSLTDGVHPDLKNIHGNGLAFDCRTFVMKPDTVEAVFAHLKLILDPLGYDVVKEGDHFHVEYDPKEAETWKEEVT